MAFVVAFRKLAFHSYQVCTPSCHDFFVHEHPSGRPLSHTLYKQLGKVQVIKTDRCPPV